MEEWRGDGRAEWRGRREEEEEEGEKKEETVEMVGGNRSCQGVGDSKHREVLHCTVRCGESACGHRAQDTDTHVRFSDERLW